MVYSTITKSLIIQGTGQNQVVTPPSDTNLLRFKAHKVYDTASFPAQNDISIIVNHECTYPGIGITPILAAGSTYLYNNSAVSVDTKGNKIPADPNIEFDKTLIGFHDEASANCISSTWLKVIDLAT